MLFFLLTVLATVLFSACGGGSSPHGEEGTDSTATSSAEAVRRIRSQEDSLFAKPIFDRAGALKLYDVYLAFAQTFPKDTMVPEYLFRAASVARSMNEPNKTLMLYDRVIADYPEWRRIADAYYLRAFTIDSDLKQKGEAKTAYEEVIKRFPDHKFAADAKQMIENMQYTDEELIERFRRMNDSTSASTGNGR
jgi:tetratricopeptide (TPR) repeat protein